ncbi:hypothetical protein CTAYLR_003452 [Chrysophaeum taylorii]|uniref:DNA primase large subunit C-terminal domain-containing protein n=1 Tax=Chrysophaeum taylorii TaxID=2483200 RepID=A0AAD7U8E8_9STRA|nr:hypothetical protein CTAYLR_003452 [Chrysophaeum taylorii]
MQVNTSSSSKNSSSSAKKAKVVAKEKVSMYSSPPRGEMSLDEFEEFAVDRLVILRMIDNLRVKGFFKTRELQQQVGPQLRKLADPRKDEISHFTLRLAHSRTEELRRWFLTQECALFRLRLEELGPTELEGFMQAPFDGETYRIPFTEALDLVSRREAKLERGVALVRPSKVRSIIVAKFRAGVSKGLAKASSYFGAAAADPRLAPLLNNVEKHDVSAPTTTGDETSGESITADQLDLLSKTSMPLCMRQTHDALRREHKLKHWGRVQYGLFLKAAGLSMEDQVRFFEQEFTKLVPHDQFHKEYAYGIRHRYGKEGKRTDYTPYGCLKIIMDFAPGPGEFHGCPYRHYSQDHLTALFGTLGLSPPQAAELRQLSKSHNYQIACQRHFEFLHPGAAAADQEISAGVGNHPNAFFKASRAYYDANNKKL